MPKEKVMAYIPARGGSKRIRNKNIRNFLDKPLIAYAIKQALALDFVGRVIVDTDSPKIAGTAKKYGAEVPFRRPKSLARDKSQSLDSLFYTLKRLKKEEGYVPDYVLILQATSPLREIADIRKCWDMIHKSGADSVVTVCPTHPRFYYLNEQKSLTLANRPKNWSDNIQDWRPGFILNGCFVYLVKASALYREKTDMPKNTKAVICPKWRSVDLDNPEDWVMAELIYRHKNEIKRKIKKFK